MEIKDDALTNALRIAQVVRDAGGRALIVGGYVRDRFIGLPSKDMDLECYGLDIERLKEVLLPFGEVDLVGKSFGVFKVMGMDVSVPRRDSKNGKGHKGFQVEPDPSMSVQDAARRRDFTMNSMSLDPITGELLDPFNGQQDLRAGHLRMTDPRTFIEDPLRVLRAAQFMSRFNLRPDPMLTLTCRSIESTLTELPGERLWEEMVKLLLRGNKPSAGLTFLVASGALGRLFPELDALIDVPQDPEWHPEGTVWVHSLMAVDAAVETRTGDLTHDLQLMFGTLLHDVGKATTTKFEDGRWRAKGHEAAGVEPATRFLDRLRAPLDLVKQVGALVDSHLAPAHFSTPKQKATPKAYRSLARKLFEAGTTMEMLHKVSQADHFGRTTPDAIAREFPAGDDFLAKAKEIQIVDKPEDDVVMGRHLIARGMKPGKEFGPILDKCRDIQYESGLKDAEVILNMVLNVS